MYDMNLFAERLGDLWGASAESSRIIHPRHVHTAASMIIQCKSSLLTGLHKRCQMLNNSERQTDHMSFLKTIWTSRIHYPLFSLTFLSYIHSLVNVRGIYVFWNGNKCVVAQRTTTSIIERCKQHNNQHNRCFLHKGVEGIKIKHSNIFSMNFDFLPTSLALLWHLTSAMPFRPVKCYSLFCWNISANPRGYLSMKIPLDQLNYYYEDINQSHLHHQSQ